MFSVASPDNRLNVRPRLRTPWHSEAQHSRWALAALSPDVQQVADGLSGRVKARLFSTLFCWARRKGRWSLLPGRATETVMRRIAGDTYVFQQDSAPAHRARDTVQLLQQETPEFIAPDLWPPNSPDLNSVNYRVWGLMQERVYRTAVRDTADLKRRLIETWSSIPQTVIDEAIDYEPASKQRDVTSSTRCNQLALIRATHILPKKIAKSRNFFETQCSFHSLFDLELELEASATWMGSPVTVSLNGRASCPRKYSFPSSSEFCKAAVVIRCGGYAPVRYSVKPYVPSVNCMRGRTVADGVCRRQLLH